MTSNRGNRPPLVAERPAGWERPVRAELPPGRGGRARRRSPRPHPSSLGGFVMERFLRLIRWVVGLAYSVLWRCLLALTAVAGLAVWHYHTGLPPASELLDARTRGSVTMLDRNGDIFAWRGEQFGGMIDADTVSPALKSAIIATEDKRFYRHYGIDPRGVASAIRINLREGRGPLSGHGGSTITQQTAKLLCLGVPFDPEIWSGETAYEDDCRTGSLWRKVKEAVYALALEIKYSKDEILTIYLNRAYLGAGTRGFEAAAQRYFSESANRVNVAEAAMLAGLLTAPSRYAPTNDLQRSRDRAATVVRLMEEQGYLTAEEAREARGNPAGLSAAARTRTGGHFADWVMDSGIGFLTRDSLADVVIRTTFDQRIQAAAEEALRAVFEEKVRHGSDAQAAVVVMSADGAVRAMVGGLDFDGVAGQFNRAIMARRQTGSAFKPFVYAAALELGYRHDDRVLDEPLTLDIPGSGLWSPQNYDEEFRGEVTLVEAFAESRNVPAVRVLEAVGRERVQSVARMFGIESDLAAGPALALGASESTLLEMTGAYAGILNGGSSVRPYGMTELSLVGDETPLMGQSGGMGERVIGEDAARNLTWMMYQVVETGTGARARLPEREAAGKTGTTQALRDAWFLGFTADYVAGVWMGRDDNTPLRGVTGGGLPAEIWRETMARVQEGLDPRPLPMDLPPSRPYVAANDLPALDGGTEPESGGIIEELLMNLFGTSSRL